MHFFEVLLRSTANVSTAELKAARLQHDNLPKTTYGQGEEHPPSRVRSDFEITLDRVFALIRLVHLLTAEHCSPRQLYRTRKAMLGALLYLIGNARLFPDMDDPQIWYTDYYDLIVAAKALGMGDDTLPHWPEEPNEFKRYLEITTSDLARLFICFIQGEVTQGQKNSIKTWLTTKLRQMFKLPL